MARAERPGTGEDPGPGRDESKGIAEFTRARRGGAEGGGATEPALQLTRPLYSPFNHSERVGEIVLDADQAAIRLRAQEIASGTVWLLAGQLGAVVLALAIMMLSLVVRPIKSLSDRLHHMDPTSGTPLAVPEGHERSEVGRLVADINDLTGYLVQTLEQERELQRRQVIAQRKYQDLFDNAATGIFVVDRRGKLESFNRAFVHLAWLPDGQRTAGRHLAEISWCEQEQLLALVGASLDGTEDSSGDSIEHEGDFLIVGRRGDERWLHVACVALGDGNAQGTLSDVTVRKREELSARHLAITDSLTGFPNRAGLQGVLEGLMTPGNPHFALLMLDMDGFKKVNEAMGFPVGDQLLLMAAERIRQILLPGDHAARIGGDEFALVLVNQHDRGGVEERIVRLLGLIGKPYPMNVAGEIAEVLIGASIGVAFFPADGLDMPRLFRSVELALNSARAEGGRCHRYFDPAQQAAVEHRRRLEDDLRHALVADQLHLVFQPIVDISAGRVVGAETLLRWSHPERGMVSPDVFIPLAEAMGMIGEIGLMVIDEACRRVAIWRTAGLEMYVSVNVSASQIPDELPLARIADVLQRHQLQSDALTIEITEGVLMADIATAQKWLGSLRDAGLRIYLDDFGTGYSSLSYLKRFPMDTVKVDKSFVREMDADNNDRTLVMAIITMAASLGLKVVAEGVEEVRQLEILREMGCGYVQGYYFSRPVAGDDFQAVVMRINADLAAGRCRSACA